MTVSLSISSALRVAKSLAGSAGSLFGQFTSPLLRFSGIETVMSANAALGPRSPENISPGSCERCRVVATSISTRLVEGTVSATGTSTPCGRLAHAERARANRMQRACKLKYPALNTVFPSVKRSRRLAARARSHPRLRLRNSASSSARLGKFPVWRVKCASAPGLVHSFLLRLQYVPKRIRSVAS